MSSPGFPSLSQRVQVGGAQVVGPVHTGEYPVVVGLGFPSYEAGSPLALELGPIELSGSFFFSIGRVLSVSATIPGFSTVIDPGPFPTGVYTMNGPGSAIAPRWECRRRFARRP